MDREEIIRQLRLWLLSSEKGYAKKWEVRHILDKLDQLEEEYE